MSASSTTSNHVTKGEVEEISENDEKYASNTTKYDCYPSWQGEFCDNIPHYIFCNFVERKKGTPTAEMQASNKTSQQHQHGAQIQSRKSLKLQSVRKLINFECAGYMINLRMI